MQIIILGCGTILPSSRLFIADLFDNLPRAKGVAHLIEATSIWLLPRLRLRRYLPCRLAILEELFPDSCDEPLLIHPSIFLLFQCLKAILRWLMAPRRHSNLFELHILLDSLHLWSYTFAILNILLLFFRLYSWPLNHLENLVVHKFWVLIYYIILSVFFLSFQCTLRTCQYSIIKREGQQKWTSYSLTVTKEGKRGSWSLWLCRLGFPDT